MLFRSEIHEIILEAGEYTLIEDQSPLGYEKAESKKKDELKKQAISRVKLGLILADIGKKNEVKIEQNEIQNAIMQEAMRYPNQAQQVFEYYTKNPQASESIKAGIFEDKVLDIVLSKVKTKEKEVSASELMKVKK